MKLSEAKAECQRWLDHLERQKEKSVAYQKVAADVRKGATSPNDARQRIREIDSGVTVYDGARLADAVKILLWMCPDEETLRKLS